MLIGTHIGDLTFNGGSVGLDMNNQQYKVRTESFTNFKNLECISSCLDCVFINNKFMNDDPALDMTSRAAHSVTLNASTASSVGTVVKTKLQSSRERSIILVEFSAGPALGSVFLRR